MTKRTNQKTEPARLLAARVLYEVMEEGAFSNESLDRHLRMSELEPLERSFAAAVVYGTLSRLFAIDLQLSKVMSKPLDCLDAYVRACLRIGAWQILYAYSVPASAAVNESVKLCRYFGRESATSFVNGVLRTLSRTEVNFSKRELGPSLGLSTEMFGVFKKWFGEQSALALAGAFLGEDVQVTIRCNRKLTNPKALIESLEQEGVSCVPSAYLSHCLKIRTSSKRLDQLSAYQKGWFMVQDEAAQLCGELSGAETAEVLLDLCAAPGGKTCDLAERMPDSASITGLDLSEERLKKARQNAERLRLPIQFKAMDAADPELKSKLIRSGLLPESGADFVLADVPCSGLGLLKRKPEIRQRMHYEDMLRFPEIQRSILQRASELCAPGGSLMYSTCTINPAENEEVVLSFLSSAAGRNFHAADLKPLIPQALLKPLLADDATSRVLQHGFLQLRPDLTPTDGFFIALLKRENEHET